MHNCHIRNLYYAFLFISTSQYVRAIWHLYHLYIMQARKCLQHLFNFKRTNFYPLSNRNLAMFLQCMCSFHCKQDFSNAASSVSGLRRYIHIFVLYTIPFFWEHKDIKIPAFVNFPASLHRQDLPTRMKPCSIYSIFK